MVDSPLELLFCHLTQDVFRFIIFFLQGHAKEDLVITISSSYGILNIAVDIFCIILRLCLIL